MKLHLDRDIIIHTKVMEMKEKFWRALMELGHLCGCHQKPERSFFYRHYQFPFCARCTGIIIGELIIAPLLLILKVNIQFYSLLLLIPLIIDGMWQYFTTYQSNNIKRLITGLMAGTGVVMCLFTIGKLIFF